MWVSKWRASGQDGNDSRGSASHSNEMGERQGAFRAKRDRSAAVVGRVDALRAMPLFSALGDDGLRRLAECAVVRRFERGRSLLQGQSEGSCVVLHRGFVKTLVPRDDMEGELVLDVHGPGQIVSDSCWIPGGRTRIEEAAALEESSAVFIAQSAIEELFEAESSVAMRFLEAFATRHARAAALAVQNASLSVGDRLYCRLVELAQLRGRKVEAGLLVEHGLAQRELASFVSASRENVNRALNEWQARGWIELRRYAALIRNADALTGSVAPAAKRVGFGAGDGRNAFALQRQRDACSS